jgi:hypothetical protein
MKICPTSVTLIACVYIIMGAIGFGYHFPELMGHAFDYEIIGIEVIRLLALIAGVFLLRGHDWARWLAVAWIGLHVILSAFHTPAELAIHSLFFVVIAAALFHPAASRYFRRTRAEQPTY